MNNAKEEPDTVVRITDATLPLKQAVWRDGSSSMFFWQSGGTFDGDGLKGDFGSAIPTGAPLVLVKWMGRDGSEQSGWFTIEMDDIIQAVGKAIKDGLAEERAGGDAKTSSVP
jgi:hypothetical protein